MPLQRTAAHPHRLGCPGGAYGHLVLCAPMEPGCIRVRQRVLQRRRSSRLPKLGGIPVGLARCRQCHHRGQAACRHLAHGALSAPVGAEFVCHSASTSADGHRLHLSVLCHHAPLLGQLGGNRRWPRFHLHARCGIDVPLQQSRRLAGSADAEHFGVRAARPRERRFASREQKTDPVVHRRRRPYRIRVPYQTAASVPGVARLCACDVRLLARKAAPPLPRCRCRVGQHGCCSWLVGAAYGAGAFGRAPLHRRLANRFVSGAHFRLQRPWPFNRQRGWLGDTRRQRNGPRRHVGRNRHIPPVQ